MKQEGGHIDFYASEATRRLSASPRAQKMTRFLLKHAWRPVGSGVMPKSEVDFLVDYLFDGPDGQAVAARIDRRVDRFPGPRRSAFAHEGRHQALHTESGGLIHRRREAFGVGWPSGVRSPIQHDRCTPALRNGRSFPGFVRYVFSLLWP